VHARFLDDKERERAHRHLAEYFERQDYFRESLAAQQARAKRLPPMPRPVNIRKVDELPFHVLVVAKLAGGDNAAAPSGTQWLCCSPTGSSWRRKPKPIPLQPRSRSVEFLRLQFNCRALK
jgi:hypothetical protein